MALLICFIVESFSSQVRNIFPHISLRDLPCHRTKEILLLHQVSLKLWLVLVPWHQQKSRIRTNHCSSPQYLCWFGTLLVQPKYTWWRNDVGSPRTTSSMRIFQVGSMFSVLPPSLISSTYTDKNSPLARSTNKHSQFRTFPNRVPVELSQIAFPIKVLPEGDRTDSFREERLGLPHWTMILTICAMVDVSK